MRYEGKSQLIFYLLPQDLLYLRRVSVAGKLVGSKGLVALRKMGVKGKTSSGSRGSRL